MPQKPSLPPAVPPVRAQAPHVKTALARAAQAKMPERTPAVASHVQAVLQARPAGPHPRVPAPHVAAMTMRATQAKLARPVEHRPPSQSPIHGRRLHGASIQLSSSSSSAAAPVEAEESKHASGPLDIPSIENSFSTKGRRTRATFLTELAEVEALYHQTDIRHVKNANFDLANLYTKKSNNKVWISAASPYQFSKPRDYQCLITFKLSKRLRVWLDRYVYEENQAPADYKRTLGFKNPAIKKEGGVINLGIPPDTWSEFISLIKSIDIDYPGADEESEAEAAGYMTAEQALAAADAKTPDAGVSANNLAAAFQSTKPPATG